MTYGTSSIDFGKGVVLFSCAFNVVMVSLIAQNPAGVIASSHGGGWWDALKTIGDDSESHVYPRIWASYLLFQLAVRLNWVFSVETAPALYRCVLLSYLLPFWQYVLECHFYKTLPPFNMSLAAFMMVPWLAIIIGYPKYTHGATNEKDKKH
jgi:hypothetical protein